VIALVYLAGSVLMLPVWMRKPIYAVYALFATALLFEIFGLGFPDSLTDQALVFINLNNKNVAPGIGVAISAAEVLMSLGLLAWLSARSKTRGEAQPLGGVLKPYLVFMLVVLFAEVRGLLSGGDFLTSLWELRPQVYGFIMFLLAASLVRERAHLRTLAIIFFACVGLKAVLADFRYFVTLGSNLGSAQAVMSHEESYFFALLVVGAFALLVWHGREKLMLWLVPLVPLAGLALVENRRRVGVLAFWVALALVFSLAVRFEPTVRKRVAILGAVLGLAALALTVTYWDHPSGTIGQLVRPIRTAVQPDTSGRDAQSDAYRIAENLNLVATYAESPLVGIGFGKPMLYLYPMADISQIYPLWNYIPHNTILWISMRMGVVGMAAFWGLVGVILLQAMTFMTTSKDRALRGIAAFAVIAVIAQLVVAWGDLQLENYRNMMFFGVMAGVVDALPSIARRQVAEAPPAEAPVADRERVAVGALSDA